jgi:hypothetical protein
MPSRPHRQPLSDEEPLACPLCLRPNYHPSDHHFVPKSQGGKVTTTICRDCHAAIHALFSNKDLAQRYATPEALLGHEEFRRMIAFIARQDPGGRVRTRRPRDRNRRR